MVNPYFCYAASFSVALILYPLGWSDLYPPLSTALVFFLLFTIGAHVVAGIRFKQTGKSSFRKLDPGMIRSAPLLVTVFLYALWIAEFIYGEGVPLFKILLKEPYDYKLFGIPSLHVFIVTFSSFYTIFLFHKFLSHRSRYLLALFLINLSAAILIYNRGMFLFNLSGVALMFLIYNRKFSIRQFAVGLTGGLVILFLFGVLGTARVSNESRVPYSNELFMKTGSASNTFRNSAIPQEYFWTYMYATSPLANLEINATENRPETINIASFVEWGNNEVLFDFISKRVNMLTGEKTLKVITIRGPFNASTVYARSFSYLGWWGLFLMATVVLVVPMIYIRLLTPASPFFLTGLVILSTVFLFMVFENTLRFTGLSFQLVYPIVMSTGCRLIPQVRKIFL